MIKQIISQARELDDLSQIDHKCSEISNMQVSGDSLYAFDVNCGVFVNRLHNNLKMAEIRVISPRGSKEGISFEANVVKSAGRICTIKIDRDSCSEPVVNEDLKRFREHKNDVMKIVGYWQEKHIALHGKSLTSEENLVQVRFYCHDNQDELLRKVRLTVSAMVRTHFVPLDFFPEALKKKAISERLSIEGFELPFADSLATQKRTIFSLP